MADNGGGTAGSVDARTALAQGIRAHVRQIIVFQFLQGLALFASSGDLLWRMAWLYLVVHAMLAMLHFVALLTRAPDLLVERSRVAQDAASWDKPLAFVVGFLGPLLTETAAGLQRRIDPGHITAWLAALGLFAIIVSFLLVLLSMLANGFFAGHVRIQSERGHRVVDAGPYALVRHPGYLGMCLWLIAVPATLGSLWAVVPAAATLVVLLVRTEKEDRLLRERLPGYAAYAARVRYRFVPGLW